MTAVRNVLISGAGIAGPALAHWLHRHGMRSTVVEKGPAPRTGGHAVDIRGVGVDVAERMGVLDAVRDAVTGTGRTTFVAADGRVRAVVPTTMDAGRGRSLEIVRGDLVRILHAPTTAYTEYLYGDSVTRLEQTDRGVRVGFRDSGPREFDLVVGADGLHSTTRGLAFGPEDAYGRYLGALISIGTVPNHLGLDREARLYNAPGLAVGMIHSPRFDGAKGIVLVREPELDGIDRAPEEAQKEFLRARLAGAGGEGDRIVRGLVASPDFYFDSVTRIRMDRWSRGRVTLLGDAGYCPSPMSGQGSTLALVGAYVLAQELSRHEDPAPALAAYEARLRPFVRANQDVADAGLGFLAPRTRLGLAARDTVLRFSGLLARLSGPDTRVSEAAEGFDLDAPAPAAR